MPSTERKKPVLPTAKQLIEEFITEMSVAPLALKYNRAKDSIRAKMRQEPAAYERAKNHIIEKEQAMLAAGLIEREKYGNPNKKRLSPDELLQQYISNHGNVAALAAQYKVSTERIRQKLRQNGKDYDRAKKNVIKTRHEELGRQFMELVKQIGHIPSKTEVAERSVTLATLYYKFRSQAEHQGYTFVRIDYPRKEIRRAEMLQYLKELAATLNRTPTYKDITFAGKYVGPLYAYYFGSLRKAQELTGLVPNKVGKPYFYLSQT